MARQPKAMAPWIHAGFVRRTLQPHRCGCLAEWSKVIYITSIYIQYRRHEDFCTIWGPTNTSHVHCRRVHIKIVL
ncbi:hypothetical protein RB195_023336 [Necator americanus]|uniref:Uncharacterized protein n=1 Tax=Necator americanus TaxID=51031 RepID=A0ABR1EIQ7_NECAM